ncbi:M23 family metallopeptidase [Phocaeicola sp.]|jgi:murein DD-endopeptidase MepM/ murein hydrolase activator NlpD|uniref:M23 family metallopeptidase n=1 Tax=Phocaeicola sp. TaxID=2773926 RepID=UPI002A838643|nr:M23 family metallopeptidase [Phocaeicola sp.]
MRKFLWLVAANVWLCAAPVKAQFNTVAAVPARYKVEVSGMGTEPTWPVCENGISTEEISNDTPASEDMDKKKWMERYLSVSYPLRRIRVTSPYGYRKDPFTGKRKFHGGLDLHARGDEVMAMMSGRVIKVGQDNTSGKYVTLQHGRYTVSYCHLSKILVVRGTLVQPRDVVGITGSTGRSTGEHLHITCKMDGKSVNPSVMLDYIWSIRQECVTALAGM